MVDRYVDAVQGQVERLEAELKGWYPDLADAFALRDWAEVARIYRRVAELAERLQELDPGAYSRLLIAAELEREELLVERDAEEDDLLGGPQGGGVA